MPVTPTCKLELPLLHFQDGQTTTPPMARLLELKLAFNATAERLSSWRPEDGDPWVSGSFPNLRYQFCCKIVASGMPYTTTEEEIRGLFDRFGPIRSLQLSRFPEPSNFRGLAFVTFESDEVAMKSLELDGQELGNRFMRVERCRITASTKRQKKSEHQSDPEKPEGCLSAYVGNLSWNITEQDLRDFFKSSKIASIRFAIDKRTGDSRGFGHVDFEDDESLEKAVRMNQSELRGRPVKIAYAIINRN